MVDDSDSKKSSSAFVNRKGQGRSSLTPMFGEQPVSVDKTKPVAVKLREGLKSGSGSSSRSGSPFSQPVSQSDVSKGVSSLVTPSPVARRVSRVSSPSPSPFTGTPGGTISAASPEQAKTARRARIKEQFIGDPLRAFTSFGDEGLGLIVGADRTGETNRFLTSGTPVEQFAALGGVVTTFGVGGISAKAATAEAALLSSAPKGFAGGLLRNLGGLSLVSAESIAASKAATGRARQGAPEQFQPFLTNNEVFRKASAAEQQAETSFVRSALGGINPNLNKRQLATFKKSAREEFKARGLKGAELDTAVDALTFRRTQIDPKGAAASTLVSGRFAEVLGRVNVGVAGTDILKGGFGKRALSIGGRIAPAGVAEVRGEIAGTRSREGSSLPFFDGPKSLLPKVSLENGFSIQSRSQVGQDIGLGLAGAGVSGVLGGLVGSGATSAVGRKGAAARGVGKTANVVGNIADFTELVTDPLAGGAGFRPKGFSKVSTIGVSSSGTPSKGGGSRSRGGLFSITNQGGPVSSLTSPSKAGGKSSPIVAPVAIKTSGGRGGSSVITPVVPIDPAPVIPVPPVPIDPTIPVPPRVPQPVNVPVNVPVAPLVPVGVNVPVASFVGRFPPPAPLGLDLGGGFGRGGRGGRTVFVNELSASLGLLGRGKNSVFKTPSLFGSSSPSKSKASSKSVRGGIVPSFNIFNEGLAFAAASGRVKKKKKSKRLSSKGGNFNIFGRGGFRFV